MLQEMQRQGSVVLTADLNEENQQMAAANRHLQQQVKELQAQLAKASALQAEAVAIRQRNSQLEQQHKDALTKAQAAGNEATAESRRLLGLLKDAEQVQITSCPSMQ